MNHHQQVLATAFAALTDKQRANLRWHAKQGTQVLSLGDAAQYVDRGIG